MGLRGQYAERGYAMAALLVALAIMAILLTVAMPVWRQQARREREAELVFRGEQYARAVALFKFKNANIPNVYPPSIDALVQGRFLRKKYKDPMTKDGEFEPLGVGNTQPGITPPPPTGVGRSNTPQPGGPVVGGISGVRSKSQETSIRSYRGATRYDQWMFTFNIAPRPGGAMPATNTPDGGRGNTPPGPFNPGQRGGPRGTNPGQPGRGTGFGPGGFPPPTQGPPSGNRGGGPGTAPGGRGRGF
jgi:type II secretory pathway pseudopilin PulG